MHHTQLSRLENGANVEVQWYERVARALGYRHALEMFRTGGDEQLRKLLRYWAALEDEVARNDALRVVRQIAVDSEEPSAT